jgi:RNA polymerase sigma-70 factor (ECF subfamily)
VRSHFLVFAQLFGRMARRTDLDISALYEQHRRELLLFFARRTADAEMALDLWAETFAQALSSRRSFRGRTDEEAAGWLYSIARRQLAQFYRRGYAEQRALDRLGIERPPADELVEAEIVRSAGLTELRRELAGALEMLSDDTRRALELRVVEELPYADVARRLAVTEPTARARVSRGLRALGHILDTDAVTEATCP